jgi:hypothetical protein
MPELPRFRVLTSDGLITYDTFVIADQQPAKIKAGCLMLVNESNGRSMTVHETRVIPLSAARRPTPKKGPRSVCLSCGRVEGVVEDQVRCPNHGDTPCTLIEIAPGRTGSPGG